MKQNKILTALGLASTAQHSTAQHSTAQHSTDRQLTKRIVQVSAFTVSCLVSLPSFAQVANYCELGMTFICGNEETPPPILNNPFDPFESTPSNPTIPDNPCWVGDYECSAQDSSVDDGYGG